MKDLSLLLQFIQGIHGLFKRSIRIRPVNQHQINMVRLKVYQRFLTLPADILPGTVPAVHLAVHKAMACRSD